MRRGSLLLLIICFTSLTFGQGSINFEWKKLFVSPLANGNTEAWGVSTDSDGNIYFPYFTDTLNTSYDILCYKFNSDGLAQWTAPLFYSLAGEQYAFSSNSSGDDLYIGGCDCPILKPECDMLLLKVDKSNGQLIWNVEKAFGPNGYEEMDGLEVQPDGIYCGGWCNTTGGNFNSDIGLWKLNFDGSASWSNSLGNSSTGDHQDGHFVVDDNYIFACGMWGGTSFFNLFDGREFLGKFSKTDGSLIDSVLFGPTGSWLNSEDALGMTTDGTSLYLTGYSTPNFADDWQIFVAKFDKNLNQQWLKYWGGSGTEAARAIAVKDGIIYIGGATNSSEFNLSGAFDAALVLFDTSGNLITYKLYGDSTDNEIRDLAFSGDDLYLSGTSGQLFSNPDPKEAFLLKVKASTITQVQDAGIENSRPVLFPNPAYNNATLSFALKNPSSVTIDFFDAAGGRFMPEQKNFFSAGNHFVQLKMENPTPGVYIIKISCKEFSQCLPFLISEK